MKKKILTILLSAVMTGILITGCTANINGKDKIQKSEAQKNETQKSEIQKDESQKAESETSNITADAVDTKKVYVTPEWVKSVIDGNQKESENYIILECSWGEEEKGTAYIKGHIPGAYHMNTDKVESEVDWNLRSPEEFKELMKEFGVTKDTTVICYGDTGTNSADDRVAFSMLWAGVENVKALDGGMESWVKAGYEVQKDSNKPKGTEEDFGVMIPAHPEYIKSIDEVKEKLENDENFKLVSIRSKEEFLGKTSGYGYIDRAGEPKGAIWGHDTDDGSYNKEDGTTVGIDIVEKYLEESGASLNNEISYYCGTGWRASIPFLIAYENNYKNVSLYDGGWYQWQMNDDYPVQLGDPKSNDCIYTTVGELATDKAKK
jgi:3-mercaptopyruvate sulfurtransferase SseA